MHAKGRHSEEAGALARARRKRRLEKISKPLRAGVSKAKKIPRKNQYTFFVIFCVVVVVIAVVIMHNSNVRVIEEEIQVVGLPRELEGYTILHLSDLHAASFGENQQMLTRALTGISYDMVAMTGDMVGKSEKSGPLLALIDALPSNKRIFLIPGDSDPLPEIESPRLTATTLGGRILADYILRAGEYGATYLDAPRAIKIGTATIWVSPAWQIGLNIAQTQQALAQQAGLTRLRAAAGDEEAIIELPQLEYRQAQLLAMAQSAGAMQPNDYHIALAHQPPNPQDMRVNIDSEASKTFLISADLVLAGHYCGGLWRLPFLGAAIYIPAPGTPRYGWFPSPDMVDGMRSAEGIHVYTSPGLGNTDAILLPKVRFFNAPSVTLIRLVQG